MPAGRPERAAAVVTAVGSLVTLVALALPWNIDAGLVSAYARSTDADLRTEQCSGDWIDVQSLNPLAEAGSNRVCDGSESLLSNSFNGVSASGGSWFGIFIAMMRPLWRFIAALQHPVSAWPRFWLVVRARCCGVLAGVAGRTAAVYLLANPPDRVQELIYSAGIGVYVCRHRERSLATGGAFTWLWRAPMSCSSGRCRPTVAWGRLAGRRVRRVAAGDGRLRRLELRHSDRIGDRAMSCSAELDAIAAEGDSCGCSRLCRCSGAAADEAAEAGDVVAEQEQRRVEQPSAATLARTRLRRRPISPAKIALAKRTGDIIHDGFESEGAGLRHLDIHRRPRRARALGCRQSDCWASTRAFRYRWSTLVAGIGLGHSQSSRWHGS